MYNNYSPRSNFCCLDFVIELVWQAAKNVWLHYCKAEKEILKVIAPTDMPSIEGQ